MAMLLKCSASFPYPKHDLSCALDLLFDVSEPQIALYNIQTKHPNETEKWQYLEEKISLRQREMLNSEIAQQNVQVSIKKARKI